MPKSKSKALKAYKNPEFLNSADARALRILSEFLEPLHRFRRQGIKDTIVFFGSARIKSQKDAGKHYKKLRQVAKKTRQISSPLRKKLEAAKSDLINSKYYEEAVTLARLLTKWSKRLNGKTRFVICSGGGPGIMEAANKGAFLAGGKTVGLNISLPYEQSTNPYVSDELNFEFHYFFMRKFWIVYPAKAFVMFPGGFGTLDELMEILTLLQTNKIKKKVTVVLYGRAYWETIMNMHSMRNRRMISEEDLELFAYKDTPQEAFDYLVKELKKNYPDRD